MKRTTVAYVDSTRDRTKRHIVIRRGSRFECTCLDFFFKDNRDEPCRHIKKVFKTKFVKPVDATGGGVQLVKPASVELTPKGVEILRDRQARQEREKAAALRASSAAT